jgi:hypothetical protein
LSSMNPPQDVTRERIIELWELLRGISGKPWGNWTKAKKRISH